MDSVKVRPVNSGDRDWILETSVRNWGAEFIVVHGDIYYPAELSGLIAIHGGSRSGLLTYTIKDNEGEIITLSSNHPNKGIGSSLIQSLKTELSFSSIERIKVVTTNDNLNALRFYQKRGFVLSALFPNAVEKTRMIKSIPETGDNGIPIRDEIELVYWLDSK